MISNNSTESIPKANKTRYTETESANQNNIDNAEA